MAPLRVPELAPLEVAARLPRLRQRFEAAEVDALVVTNLTNVRYLTGFTGSAAVLAITAEGALLTTDGRYRTQSAEQLTAAGMQGAIDLCIGGVDVQRDALGGLLATGVVGLEADSVTWAQATGWEERLGRSLVATSGVVEALRQVKDAGELARMGHAAAIADAALRDVLSNLGAPGMTEEGFAHLLDSRIRELGAEGNSFETIVASGENSAKPHHHPGSREIRQGDPVVLDFGALFEGYCSDMTRTFRTLITDAGYGERFEHSTGHGIGLDVHEMPWVSTQGTAILEPGVVVTVEPGVYVAGIGGVRIEDTLVITTDGAEPLTKFTKDVAA